MGRLYCIFREIHDALRITRCISCPNNIDYFASCSSAILFVRGPSAPIISATPPIAAASNMNTARTPPRTNTTATKMEEKAALNRLQL